MKPHERAALQFGWTSEQIVNLESGGPEAVVQAMSLVGLQDAHWSAGRAHGLRGAWALASRKSREPHQFWRQAILELVIELERMTADAERQSSRGTLKGCYEARGSELWWVEEGYADQYQCRVVLVGATDRLATAIAEGLNSNRVTPRAATSPKGTTP